MQFFFNVDTAATRERAATFANVTYACTAVGCSSENTVETTELVPSGVHYKVRCEHGHISEGMPPKAFRATTREDILAELAAAKTGR